MVFEKNKDVAILEQLGFAHCRLSLAIPKEEILYRSGIFHEQKGGYQLPEASQRLPEKE